MMFVEKRTQIIKKPGMFQIRIAPLQYDDQEETETIILNDDIPVFIEEMPEDKLTKEYPAIGYHHLLYSNLEVEQKPEPKPEPQILRKSGFEYIRSKYNVPVRFGCRVRKGKKSGMVCGCDGDYLVIKIYGNVVFWLPDQVEYL